VDNLRGLKENVIIGHLIPAGTGVRDYDAVDIFQEVHGDLEGNYEGGSVAEAETETAQ